ncbi:MAG: antitermination protein NusG [Planctomycetia bacterium]|nr:antitermination protein NusG [Planctomycetia bacterium]
MPILSPEPSIYPADLLEHVDGASEPDVRWWALYSLPRQEKQLMRRLHAQATPFYSPVVPKRSRSPSGRVRVSHVPLFSGYVFLYGSGVQRHAAMTTNCVSRCLEVPDGRQLSGDLRRIFQLIATGQPLTPEARLEPGEPVRIRSGALAGLEGVVIRRANETRLLVAVNFLQRGASVLLDDCQVETLC